MKIKYSESTDTAEIFDIIHNSMVLDFGYVYNLAISSPMDIYKKVLDTIGSFSSLIKSQTKIMDKKYQSVSDTVNSKCPE